MAALGLRCCTWAFSSCGEQGLLLVVVCGLLIVVASLVVEHGLQVCRLQQLWHTGSVVVAHRLSSCGSWALEHRLSSCGAQAQLLGGMWDLPGPGLEPVSPAMAGGFSTTTPPGKPQLILNVYLVFNSVILQPQYKLIFLVSYLSCYLNMPQYIITGNLEIHIINLWNQT